MNPIENSGLERPEFNPFSIECPVVLLGSRSFAISCQRSDLAVQESVLPRKNEPALKASHGLRNPSTLKFHGGTD
jgi:hypothetical protein